MITTWRMAMDSLILSRSLFIVCIRVVALMTLALPVMAANNPGIILNPLPVTPSTSLASNASVTQAGAIAQSASGLNRIHDTVARLKGLNSGPALLANSASPANKALLSLHRQVGQGLSVLGTEDGIPRQIKGGVLEPRTVQSGPEKTIDMNIAGLFLTKQKTLLGLVDPSNEMQLESYEKDEFGRRHLRYSQTHQGLPVWPAEALVHINVQGNVDAFDGGHVKTPKKGRLDPALDKATAITKAQLAVPQTAQSTAEDLQLIMYAPAKQQAHLAWKMELPVSLTERWLVVIDAINGATLLAYNQIPDANVSGSGTDKAGFNRPLNVWQENGQFWLQDTSKAMFNGSFSPLSAQRKGVIEVWDAQNKPASSVPSNYADPVFYYTASSTPYSGWVADAVGAAYNLSATYDYYRARHNRNSYDNAGSTITAIVRYGLGFYNAFWSGQSKRMIFGDADRFSTSLDVVGHELTHAVTEYSANLVYQNQSGALNEAFSDILGESIEAYTRGSNDWLIGSDMQQALRSMKNPELYGQPSKMGDYKVMANDENHDNGGVHINSGIINHAYYLLAEGLSGGIGMTDATRIFYRALTVHLVQNSEFIDARRAAVLSAEEIFGVGSVPAQRTAQAFDAVEISDGSATQVPRPVPTVQAADSLLSLYYDPYSADWFLTRLESGLGDPSNGRYLTNKRLALKRPAIEGDGSMAYFVTSDHDLCITLTNDGSSVSCLGMSGEIASIAVAPKGDLIAVILRDSFGNPTNTVTILDMANSNNDRTITLKAPVADATPIAIDHADAMAFTADSHYLIFDAYNKYTLANGTASSSWSIYAMNLTTNQFQNLINVVQGLDIAFPSAGHTQTDLIVFEAKDQVTDLSTIYTANLTTGKLTQVGQVAGAYAVPSFNGDDQIVLFSRPDNTNSSSSLYLQSLAADHTTPVGNQVLGFADRDMGVIYRRGEFVGVKDVELTMDATFGNIALSPSGNQCDNKVCSQKFPQDTPVTLLATPISGYRFDHWVGCDRVGGRSCSLTMTSTRSVEAWFKSTQAWTLNVSNSKRSKGAGKITSVPSGIDCNLNFKGKNHTPTQSGSCSASFPADTDVTLMLDPQGGLVMDANPAGCDVGSGQTCIAKASATTQSYAAMGLVFGPKNLTVSTEGAGKVTSEGINCGNKCYKSYPKTKVTKLRLLAKPAKNWQFNSWQGCDVPKGLACVMRIHSPRAVKALFKVK